MSQQPSAELLAQLDEFGLATAEQVATVRARVRKLAGKLPWFDSVWVDALRQARLLTPYQATEFSAGRGDALRLGAFVVLQPLGQCHYGQVYAAREIATRRPVRLLVASIQSDDPAQAERQLRRLIESSAHLTSDGIPPVFEAGVETKQASYRLWTVSDPADGIAAAEWMVASGRFSPVAVLEIARQMVAALAELERLEIVHADLSTSALLIDNEGNVRLPHAGVRAIARPEEGYGFADLPPDAYDFLAPERVIEGTAPTSATDLYACGGVWWNLLTGRGPLGGGDGLSRLQAAHRAKISDVSRLAPETPVNLAAAIRQCLEHDPLRRPDSFAMIAQQLGPSTRGGRESLAACVADAGRPTVWQDLAPRPVSTTRRVVTWLAATVAGLMAVGIVAMLWETRLAPLAANLDATAEANRREHRAVTPAVTEQQPVSAHRVPTPTATAMPRLPEQGEAISPNEQNSAAERERVLLLSAERVLRPEDLSLRPGLVVRGMNGARPRIEVPPRGLTVAVDDVRFENIDFVASDSGEPVENEEATLIVVRSRRVEFRGCTFRAPADRSRVAIHWRGQHDSSINEIGPTSELIVMADCLLRGVAAGVAIEETQDRAVEMSNTLVLGPGPLLRIDGCPQLDEPMSLRLSQVTVRGASSLVECRYEAISDQPGQISVHTDNCVFAPATGGVLLLGNGLPSPEDWLRRIEWTGEGSLLAEQASVAGWLSDTASPMIVDDAELSIDGLARSRITFASSDRRDVAGSLIIDWSAPLATKTPPGVRRRVVSR